MKKAYILLLVLIIASIFIMRDFSYAATVGNSLDLDLPPRSALLREEVIEDAMDGYEQIVKIKAALDLEFIFDKDLHTSFEMQGAEIKGQWQMFKLGVTIFNRVEPYIKIGTSELDVKWNQGPRTIEVGADSGFAWGAGVKGVIWEFEDLGLRLTGDAQYRKTEPDVGDISVSSVSVTDTGADFNIKEWQASLLLSRKFEVPLKWQNIYIVPYTGLSISDSTVDVSFIRAGDAADYSLFDANNDEIYGFILGCDIMPNLSSSFAYSMEVRLLSETSLTLGGAMKF
ncbi:MAG: hypothetical protein HQ532_04610 [Candidatus Omnitrophica bacterium]|nr:hypothetical protein [Candidatus Omnitrophota bacterium]